MELPAATPREGIARSIDQTLSVIPRTSTSIARFIRSVRAAHGDLSTVTRDLSDLRLVLELMRDEPEIPHRLDVELVILLGACQYAMAAIETAVARCPDSVAWLSGTSKDEVMVQRANLAMFREALALVLEVVTLATPDLSKSDAIAVEIQTRIQIDRLRDQSRSSDERIKSALGPYLDAVFECSQASSRKGAERRWFDDATRARRISDGDILQSGLEQLHLANSKASAAAAQQRASLRAPSKQDCDVFESSGPWYPTAAMSLPYYGPNTESASGKTDRLDHVHQQIQGLPYFQQQEQWQRIQQHRKMPPPSSPNSRTSIPGSTPPQSSLGFHSAQSSQSRPSWDYSASSSLSQQESPPPQSAGRWGEPYRHQQFLGQMPASASHSRNASFSSTGPLNPSSIAVQAALLYRSGSASPGIPSSGALSPALGFQQPDRLRSITPSSCPPPAQPLVPPPSSTFASVTPTTNDNSSIMLPPPSISAAPSFIDARPASIVSPPQLKITPSRHLVEKGKNQDVAHLDTSPSGNYLATRHTNKYLKIWSVHKNAVFASIKTTSYVQPQPRSREYFVRSHAMLSENACLIGITTHFGLTLEIYNFSKGGSGAKKVQVIDDAHRWAASKLDAYHTSYAPLVVYRPKSDRIDRFFLARHPGAKKPFWEDATNAIELTKANLPFIPKFPELAYSSNSPYLFAAAGPRPGEPPRANPTILIAWQMTPVSDNKLQARSPVDTIRSLEDESHHLPHRYCVPEYPALQTALPSCLAAHGTCAVSIWIPANHTEVQLPGNKYKRKPMPAPERFVLVWDLLLNTTRIFAIPNVQACVSPDCRWVAYCDANAGQFVVLDVASGGKEVWRCGPDAMGRHAGGQEGFASFGGQLESLQKVTVFEFSADGQALMVGDVNGGVGVYNVVETSVAGEVRFELPGAEVGASGTQRHEQVAELGA
ncbi:hypothetical protein B0T18DRAFT_236649 [Schizothecium vesticola]|uniref:Uncharacterized protein n=1 Tax=Schizothecium vesticola TaxID=314040 RepID=A0AA40BPM8_9PEZI|nr:hypothetical protein B0T18DRAFT_236649 [Schizothecium vesticola]